MWHFKETAEHLADCVPPFQETISVVAPKLEWTVKQNIRLSSFLHFSLPSSP